jgi:hypothetical protein
MGHEVTITPGEIRRAWDEIQAGQTPFTALQADSGVQGYVDAGTYRGSRVDPFIGCSGQQMQEWLTNGYNPPAAGEPEVPAATAEISVPTVQWAEEDGDLVIAQALGGEDLAYLRWEEFEARRGLRIRACFGMTSAVRPEVIAAYYDWVLSVVDAAQRRGLAPELEIWKTTARSFGTAGRPDDDLLTVRLPLVGAGELVDAVAWRAFLSPGGCRLAADRIGRRLTETMGGSTGRKWTVTMDGDVLDIGANASARWFPREQMDAQLAQLAAL